MANLSTRTKFVNIVIRKKNLDIFERHALVLKWCQENCELYSFIYHKNDYDLEGVKEHPHCHIVATLKSAKRLSTTLYSLCAALSINSIGVEIDKINSYEGSLQYLLHKNDPQKTQHTFDELYHNYNDDELKVILETESDSLTAQRLYDIVRHSRTNYDIMKALGIHRYHNLRNCIRDLKEDLGMLNLKSKKVLDEK